MLFDIAVIDLFVLSAYILLIFILAYYSGKNVHHRNSATQHYLAGKSLTFFESLCSIIATEVSALTFLGIPAYAFTSDFSFVQIYIGALFARVIIGFVFLPKIYDQGLTIYSVMGKNATPNGQRCVAAFYFINKVLAVGVRLFAGSILIAKFLSIDIHMAVGLICVLTYFYTAIGGLKAVARTDIAQLGLFLIGGVTAHFLIPQSADMSWSELMSYAFEHDKTSFFKWDNPWPFITGVLGGALFDMSTHGVDQDFVQRLIANKSRKLARRAIIASTFLSIGIGFLFLSIGALLWSFYQHVTPPDIGADQLFAHFITHYFPHGVQGLMVAATLAGTMSTLDSTINALGATYYSDILNASKKFSEVSKEKMKEKFRIQALIITLLLMGVSFIASKYEGMLVLGLEITSWTAGSLLALFMVTVIFNLKYPSKMDAYAVLGAYAFGTLSVAANHFIFQTSWLWNVYFGFFASTIFLYLKGRFVDAKV